MVGKVLLEPCGCPLTQSYCATDEAVCGVNLMSSDLHPRIILPSRNTSATRAVQEKTIPSCITVQATLKNVSAGENSITFPICPSAASDNKVKLV